MAVIIAGERSGVGKTTVTLALLAAMVSQDQSVQSFKIGPDYIDPMFHSKITGRACRNLDPVLTSEQYVQSCFAKYSQPAEYALIEGVMGLFDGSTGRDDTASTAHIARLLNIPVVLILNCASTSRSIAAISHGYRTFDPRINIAGVILNRVGSDRHLELLTQALEPLHLPILGVLRRQDDITIPDRHLGLIPTGEITNFNLVLDRLTQLGKTCFDWQKLLPLMKTEAPTTANILESNLIKQPVRIAIAQDAAFNFYYADNLDMLSNMGAELVPWSPIQDTAIPPNIQGLYFGGGFPEVFAPQLSANQSARNSVKTAIKSGIPTIAECGGLMYLCDRLEDFDHNLYAMVGIFPTTAVMGKRLTLGYRQALALTDSCLVKTGDRIWGHEFHRSTLTESSNLPLFNLSGFDSGLQFPAEGWQKYQVHASYVHLHFGAQPHLVERFLGCCLGY
ncbi:cobyrinic acid a,c-diamide synthase [Synechococcus sp. PCC 7502]|uniref:cobyrinate a,c-diamide synthase n=1 Tax=Synechococcus sp. PCC 7502 TaxID=1173263 RepID=UPI00029FDE64|nr:cobyrinate a,c-diamide synthase [Synechococcus sp. PCC 7502]AFY72663.1 cobyrinic acid a,c-diamide synthase [Synechococcus sp. PCC 7502]